MILLSPTDKPLATAKEGSETSGTEHTRPSGHLHQLFFYHFGASAAYLPTGNTTKKLPPSFICATGADNTENTSLPSGEATRNAAISSHILMRSLLQVLHIVLFFRRS